MLIDPGSAVCVAVAWLGNKHYRRLVPTARRHVANIFTTDFLCQIFFTGEKHLNIFMHPASTIPTDINHNAVAVGILAQKVGIHRAE
jgi:hypothetical protein